MEKGGGNTVVGGAVAPCPPPLAWETEAMLTCAVIAQSFALDCTGFYKIVCYVRYIQICDRDIYDNLLVIDLPHSKLLWVHIKTRRISLVYNLWCMVENWGKLCQQEPDVHQQDPHFGATLTLPALVAAGWPKFFKQTLIHLIQREGTTIPLIPAKSDQWLG